MTENNLTIIIVSWNTKKLLEDCLQSLGCGADNGKFKVIVVDNNSEDGSEKYLRELFPDVKFIQSGANIGFARATNLAYRECETPYILFLNPDTQIRQYALEKMLEKMDANEQIGAVGCKMIYPDGKPQPLGLQWYPTPLKEAIFFALSYSLIERVLGNHLPKWDPTKEGFVAKLYGGCMMVRKSVIDQVGPFDDRYFMYVEDGDLSRRIREMGYLLAYLPTAEVIHVCGSSTKKAPSSFSHLMKLQSLAKYMNKYYGIGGEIRYRILMLMASLLRLFGSAVAWLIMPVQRDLLTESIRKCWLTALWSTGVKNPIIAE